MLQWCRLSEEMEVELPVKENHDLTTFLAKLRSTVQLPGLQLLYKIVVEGSRAIVL